jgi:teichuronic acid biosynthesis glycosyltransferase TuaH
VHALVIATADDVFRSCNERRKVLFGTDDLVAGAELLGIPRARLRAQEERLLADADVVLAVSPELVATWEGHGARPRLIPNGCDVQFLDDVDRVPPADDVHLRPPIAGLVGHLSERVDFGLLRAVAESGASLLLIGPRSPGVTDRMEALLSYPNVQWVGVKPYDSLKRYLRIIDVGLVPYTDTEFNRASFPLKLLEYLAAGRGVVTTDLPSARWLDTPLIDIAHAPSEFAACVTRRLCEPRTAAIASARRAFAAHHSWELRALDFAVAVGLADERTPARA